MKILFDNNVPAYLTRFFPGHEVITAYRQGWAAFQNGKLLAAAEQAGFDLFVTMDKNVQFQQRIHGRSLCIAVLDPQGQAEEDVVLTGVQLFRRLHEIQPGIVLAIRREDI